jgi:hypothetical protein
MIGALVIAPAAQAQQSVGLPWWLWLLLLVLVIVLFIWWLRRSEMKKAPPTEATAPTDAPSVTESAPVTGSDEPEAAEAVADSAAEAVPGAPTAGAPLETQPPA